MLGAEERDERHARSTAQYINGRIAGAIDAGLIRDQADAQSAQLLVSSCNKNVDSVQGVRSAERPSHAAENRRRIPRGSRGESAEVVLEGDDVAFAVRMDAIGEKDVERFRRRIDPEESAGEPCVAVRSDRKHLAARLGG